MNVKLTLVLLGVLILLVVAIIAMQEPEQGPMTDPRLVPGFSAEDVTALSWTGIDRETVLRRAEDGGDEGWTVLVSGQEVPASPVEIKEILNDIERCRIRKRLPADGVDAQSRQDYGLDPAVTRVSIELRGEKREILLGEPGVGRDTTYAQVGEDRDVLIVDNDLMTQISGLGAAALRARRLFDWSVYRVVEFEIADANGVRLAARRKAEDKDFWEARAPFSGDLDPEAVESRLLAALLNMEAEEFSADGVAEDGLGE